MRTILLIMLTLPSLIGATQVGDRLSLAADRPEASATVKLELAYTEVPEGTDPWFAKVTVTNRGGEAIWFADQVAFDTQIVRLQVSSSPKGRFKSMPTLQGGLIGWGGRPFSLNTGRKSIAYAVAYSGFEAPGKHFMRAIVDAEDAQFVSEPVEIEVHAILRGQNEETRRAYQVAINSLFARGQGAETIEAAREIVTSPLLKRVSGYYADLEHARDAPTKLIRGKEIHQLKSLLARLPEIERDFLVHRLAENLVEFHEFEAAREVLSRLDESSYERRSVELTISQKERDAKRRESTSAP